jgi:hypothetical protein
VDLLMWEDATTQRLPNGNAGMGAGYTHSLAVRLIDNR